MDYYFYEKQFGISNIKKIYQHLKKDLSKKIEILPLEFDSSAFRINLNIRYFQLSIAYPLGMRYSYCETALCYNNPELIRGTLIYIDYLGYEDIKRFDSHSKLLNEIYRLYFEFEKIKNTFRKAIYRYRAKKYIQTFILEYKDHFMARPFGKLYYQSLKNFQTISDTNY